MAMHRIYIETGPDGPELAPGDLTVAGEEAHHAIRVKRLGVGDRVEILDGKGRIGAAAIMSTEKGRQGWSLALRVEGVQAHAAPSPELEVCCPPPKGPRLSEMIDGLSQAGAARWLPLTTAFSVAEAREHKLERTRRIASESSKQCGRPWLLEVGEPLEYRRALRGPVALVIADASGGLYRASSAPAIRLLVGPEGGWRPDELAGAREAGAQVARFGPYTMRVETAVVAATAIILDHELR